MKIYQTEKDRGLDKVILANTKASVNCLSPNRPITKADTLYKNEDEASYIKEYVPDGMTLINAILVSTNWNRNDDVFTPEDTWLARRTPMFTPANLNHQGREGTDNNIIGVIGNCIPVDDNYKWLDVPKENDLPSTFHLLVGTYVWSDYFPSVMGTLESKIKKGEMFVSMEAFFDDFGYALRVTENSNVSLMPRNEITSWLTSYLRCYGGPGKVTIDGVEYQLGRWLRDITFSGMGFVENPANPESIVFEDYITASKKNGIKFEHIKDEIISTWGINKDPNKKNFSQSSVLSLVTENRLLWLTS